jgi:hypothetical protein
MRQANLSRSERFSILCSVMLSATVPDIENHYKLKPPYSGSRPFQIS